VELAEAAGASFDSDAGARANETPEFSESTAAKAETPGQRGAIRPRIAQAIKTRSHIRAEMQ